MKHIKKKKILKAWIQIQKDFVPMIIWKKPPKKEIETNAEYGFKIIPCTITYET